MKYVVMETGKDHVIVLSCSGKFIKIKNKNYTMGQEITIPKYNYSMMATMAVCFIIICLSVFSGYRVYSTPECYVSIDINPSIQLTTNRFNKVIDTQSFNSDGKIVLEQGKIKHKSVEDSIERIIDISVSLGYLSDNNKNVVIGVVASNENTVEVMQNKIGKYKTESIVVEIEQTDEKMLELSKELGESVGRAKAIYDYTDSYGGDIKGNKKKLEKESVAEIKNSGNNRSENSGNNRSENSGNNRSENSSNNKSKNSDNNRSENNSNNKSKNTKNNKSKNNKNKKSKNGNKKNNGK